MNGTLVAIPASTASNPRATSPSEQRVISSPKLPTPLPAELNGTLCHCVLDNLKVEGGSAANSTTTTRSDTRMLVSTDGAQIYANAVGDGTKQAIVFIHGFVWSFMAFDDIFNDPKWTSQLYLVSSSLLSFCL